MSASSGLGLLQMKSELVTRRCASEDSWHSEGVDSEIPDRLERTTMRNGLK